MSTGYERPRIVEAEVVADVVAVAALVARPAQAPGAVDVVDGVGGGVVEGQVVRVIEIERYPQARSALGGCTSFAGCYVTDPAEIAAIARRVGGAR